ncbi:MAG: VUT family protein [Chloroflexota bacterium]
MRKYWLIGSYLIAIVMANLLVTRFGKIAVLPVGFLFVGLDITGRDFLHEIWTKNRWLKMALLIAAGSVLSWLINRNSEKVAIASFLAFAGAGIVDTLTYTWLQRYKFLIRVNGSNLFSSLTDSALFLTLAFGTFMPFLIFSQFAVKVAGGFVWSLILRRNPAETLRRAD